MKRTHKISFLVVNLFLGCMSQAVFAQKTKDIFNSSETPITYLGIDFTQALLMQRLKLQTFCQLIQPTTTGLQNQP